MTGVELATKRVFETMNGLRGVAALAVVAFHWSLGEPFKLTHGYLAVDLFFALSGFVVAHSYEDRLIQGMPTLRFFIIRTIRLYPLYIMGSFLSILIICASLAIHGLTKNNISGLIEMPFALLMAPSPPLHADWSEANLYPLNRPAWSLFYEIIANVAYAASARFWSVKRLLLLMCAAGSALILHLVMAGPFYGDGGWNWSSIHLGLLRVFYSFPAGVLIYKLYRGARLQWIGARSLYIVASLPLFLIAPAFAPEFYAIPFNVLVGFPLLVLLAAGSDEPQGGFARFYKYLGAASYATYVLHQPFHSIVEATLAKLSFAPAPLLRDAVLMAAIIPLSFFIDRIYDDPVRKALTRRFVTSQRD